MLIDEIHHEGANVKDFGAKGDGVTDDLGAFKKAISYTQIERMGGTISRSPTMQAVIRAAATRRDRSLANASAVGT